MIRRSRACHGLVLASSLAGALTASTLFAASPALDVMLPRGIQRGTEVEVSFRGQRLGDAQEALVYQPGVTVTDLKAVNDNTVSCKFKVADDAAFGEYQVRLRTATGITELRNFYVGVYPVVKETAEVGIRDRRRDPKDGPIPKEQLPSTFENPQQIPLNVTVEGVIEREQTDFYAVEAKAGDRLNVECEGVRLGKIFDTCVAVSTADGKQIAFNDDNDFAREDPVLSCTLPADGKYIVQVRDSTYGGDDKSFYRLHVGTFPRPRTIFPLGGRAGQQLNVRFQGDLGGDFEQSLTVPQTPGQTWPVFAERDGLRPPTANLFRVCDFDSVVKSPSADIHSAAHALAYSGSLPVAFDGIIEKPGDTDFFQFHAEGGRSYDVSVYARRLRSPLDPFLVILDGKGSGLQSDDDGGGQTDSFQRFKAPADGNCIVAVRDHLKRGGPNFVYRIEVTPTAPSLSLAIPNAGVNPTQERQVVAVPRGGRYATMVRATRSNVDGTLTLETGELPQGVHMTAAPIAAGQDTFVAVFDADADAPLAGKLVDLRAKSADSPNVVGEFRQPVVLAWENNRPPYYVSTAERLAVAVINAPPYTLEVVQPEAPLVQAGLCDLKVKATRRDGWNGVINVGGLWELPGTGIGALQIKPDTSEGTITINAQPNAKVGSAQTALLSSADVSGTLWVASNPFTVEVAPPFVAAQFERSSVEQGKAASVVVKLVQKVPFDGKAKVELLGLPNGATAEPCEITKDDKDVRFEVKTTDKTPVTTHRGLLCRITVFKSGAPIIHNAAQGGVLRIDKPAATPAGEKPVAVKG